MPSTRGDPAPSWPASRRAVLGSALGSVLGNILGNVLGAGLGAAGWATSTVRAAAAETGPRRSPALRARARLFDAGAAPDAGRLAAIAITLDPGFQTYWRTPGEAGIPPALDWTGSENLARAEVLWPAPERLEEAGGVIYGWKEGAFWPVRVSPVDADRPVALRLALAYGACREICVPLRADLALTLLPTPPVAPPQVAADLAAALASVPVAVPPGAAGPLAVLSASVAAPVAGAAAGLAVRVRAPEDAALFVEAPDGWFLLAEARSRPGPGGARVFPVSVLERPPDAATLPLTLTLAAPGERAVETRLDLDTRAWPR